MSALSILKHQQPIKQVAYFVKLHFWLPIFEGCARFAIIIIRRLLFQSRSPKTLLKPFSGDILLLYIHIQLNNAPLRVPFTKPSTCMCNTSSKFRWSIMWPLPCGYCWAIYKEGETWMLLSFTRALYRNIDPICIVSLIISSDTRYVLRYIWQVQIWIILAVNW